MQDIDIVVDYPAKLALLMQQGSIDLALLPVAAIPTIKDAQIIADYGIASDGNVASVALFSRVPIEDIATVYLDYQSRTSVRLAQLLLHHYWKKEVVYIPAPENYIDAITGNKAGVIIGDRALMNLSNFEYVYDLSKAWKAYTGLDFIFAAWVANKKLPADFILNFNEANASGIRQIDKVVAENPYLYYDLHTYYTRNIKFYLDNIKKQGLIRFLEMIESNRDILL